MKAAGLLVNQAALLVLKPAVRRLDDEASCLAYQNGCICKQLGCTAHQDMGGAAVGTPADSITHKLRQVSSRVLAHLKPRQALMLKPSEHLATSRLSGREVQLYLPGT